MRDIAMGNVHSLKKLSDQKGFKDSFLAPDEDNIDSLFAKMKVMLIAALDRNRNSGRRQGRDFLYVEEDGGFAFPAHGMTTEAIAAELGVTYEGTIRWHHPNAAFNITPTPDFDVIAAATVAMILNPNCLWDKTSGHLLLAEQKIARAIGGCLFPEACAGGFSTFGGTATLMYGIKAGMITSDHAHKREGLRGRQVVFASHAAHYSLEDVADYLGLGTSAIIRVPCDHSGGMDLRCFETELGQSLLAGKRVAAVIVNGGVTIDFSIDDAIAIKRICSRMEVEHGLGYAIHLHGDTVAGWAWIFADEAFLQDGSSSSRRILEAKRRLACMKAVDSVGIDFHKTGLCPYNTTFFILKDREGLRRLGGYRGAPDLDARYGDFHAHHMTLENSRPATGIVAAYASMLKLGRDGLARYLRFQQDVRETYQELIANHFADVFTVLNRASLGFELVVAISRPEGGPMDLEDYLAVQDRLWMTNGHDNTPIVGFVPCYQTPSGPLPAMLIYPMSPHSDRESCLNLLRQLKNAAIAPGVRMHALSSRARRADLIPPR